MQWRRFGFLTRLIVAIIGAAVVIGAARTAPAIIAAGVLIAIASGGLMGVLHALLSVTYKVDQIISGTIINILAVGITGFLNRSLFFQTSAPHSPGVLPTLNIPLLGTLPVIGPIFQ